MKSFESGSSIVYPDCFWSFDINARLRYYLINELLEHDYSKESIDVVRHSALIETIRQSIYIKRYDAKYSINNLIKLIFLTFKEYYNNFYYWIIIFPVLETHKIILKPFFSVIYKIYGSKIRLNKLFNT